MSRGLPVLYTEGEGFDGLFPDGEVGYPVNPKDPSDMVRKIKLCLNDYASMSKRCVENTKKFRWIDIARRYTTMYQKIVNPSQG